MSTTAVQQPPPSATAARSARPRRLQEQLRENGVYAALIALVLYNVIATPHFNSLEEITTIALQTGVAIIVSLGMLFVIGTGGIDLSVGATMAIAGAVLGKILAKSSTVTAGQLMPTGH